MREFLFSWFCINLRRTGASPLPTSHFEELVAVDAEGRSTVLDRNQLRTTDTKITAVKMFTPGPVTITLVYF